MERLTYRNSIGGAEWMPYPSMSDARDKLCAYEEAEENGTLIKLPVKVGDTVWVRMQNGGFAEAEVVDYTHFLTCGFCLVLVSKKFCKQNIPFSEVGKTVFLTREEAEEALKEGDSNG